MNQRAEERSHELLSVLADGQFHSGELLAKSLGVAIAVWRLMTPARLELSPSGLTWFSGRKTMSFRWDDFDHFVLFRVTAFTSHTGYVLGRIICRARSSPAS